MFQLWQTRHLSKDCWYQGNDNGAPVQGNNLNLQNDNTIISVAVVKSTATIIKGSLGGVGVELMVES